MYSSLQMYFDRDQTPHNNCKPSILESISYFSPNYMGIEQIKGGTSLRAKPIQRQSSFVDSLHHEIGCAR